MCGFKFVTQRLHGQKYLGCVFTRALRSWIGRGVSAPACVHMCRYRRGAAAPACVHMCRSVMAPCAIFEWGHLHGEWPISKRPHVSFGFWTHWHGYRGLEQDCPRSQITQHSTVYGESVRAHHIFYRSHIIYSHGNGLQIYHMWMRNCVKNLKMHDT